MCAFLGMPWCMPAWGGQRVAVNLLQYVHAQGLLLLLPHLHESQFGALMHEWIAACCAINTRDEQRSCAAAGANSESRPRFFKSISWGLGYPSSSHRSAQELCLALS